jgi:phage terminase small subunit
MPGNNQPIKPLGLTPKQERFVLALLSADSIADACRAVGIKAYTGTKWMREPAILARLKQARKAVFDSAISEIQGAMGDAVRLLRRVVNDETVGASVRVRAADCILNHGINGQALEQLQERIESLETALQQQQQEQGQYRRSA